MSITTSGPYREYHSPWGKVIGHHDDIYVNKDDHVIGKIFIPQDSTDRFVIYYAHPHKEFKTLKGAINYIVKNPL